MSTFTESTRIAYDTEKCWVCGVHFAMELKYSKRRLNDGKSFYCPNGCQIRYGTPPWKEIEQELQRERQQHDQTRARLSDVREQRDGVERRLSAQKGVTTRIKNRVSKGVCPCCNRTFENLARHMKSKHPDYAESTT